MELLLLFGTHFSKFRLFGQFHLYDLAFAVLAGWALLIVVFRHKWPPWPIILLGAISSLYLVYSFVVGLGPIQYIVRHYALFLYMGGSAAIVSAFIDPGRGRINIHFTKLVAILSVGLQFLFVVYLLLEFDSVDLLLGKNAYSPLAIMGVIVGSALALVMDLKIWLRLAMFAGCLLLSLTLGFSSAALACGSVLFFYFALRVTWMQKVVVLGLMVALVIIMAWWLPDYFLDYNSQWRFIYWRYSLEEVAINYYGILGHGFGGPYISEEVVQELASRISSQEFIYRIDETYLSPSHNSFITMAFHIGLLPSLLILVPLRKPFLYFWNRRVFDPSPSKDFLILSLIGLSVWASANVILELPHSSAFYWLVYFTLVYQFKASDPKKVAEA